MDIAKFAVTRPVAVTMRIAALVLLGAIAFTRLPVDLLPNVSLPTVAVITQWPNVAPEEVEAEVTRPIEEAVSSASNLYQVSSNTTEGSSVVIIQFQWGSDVGQAAVDVLQLAERARQSFPNDPTLGTPVVFKFDPTQLPILVFGVSGDPDPVKLRTLVDNQITPMIESANGVASAVATGGEQRAVIVNVDTNKLQAYNASLNQVIRRISQENVNLPAGIAKQSDTEYTIRSLGWYTSPRQIAQTPLGLFNGQNINIGQVADVQDSHSETRLYTRLNGQPSVGIIVVKQSGANTISTAQAVFDKIALIQKLYPNLKFGLATDQSQFIRNSVNDVRSNAFIGGILAALILLFFLRNVRSTLVVATSIPISIISTFALLYVFGFTLNTMSLGAIALSTGLIVDDAVVVLENIFRHLERDKRSAMDAAIVGTNEIFSAVTASTWTVIVVFLPLFLIKGQAGQMFTQFALVVIFSILVSLLDATTVVPMLANRLIKEAPRTEVKESECRGLCGLGTRAFAAFGRWFENIETTYRHALKWAIHHRPVTIVLALLVTIASLLLVPYVGFELMPQTDSGDFNGIIKLPIGTSLQTTNKTMKQVERVILNNPNVENVFGAAGTTLNLRGSTTALVPFQGSVTVRLKDNRNKPTVDVMADLRRTLSGISSIRPLLTQVDIVSLILSGGPQNIEVDIFGSDLSTLSDSAKDVMSRIQGIPNLQNIDVNWQEAMPEIQWVVDRQKATQLGLNFSDIADTISTATDGTIASYYQEGGFEYPILVQMPESVRKTIPEMERLVVVPSAVSPTSQEVGLKQVAHPVKATGPSQITRLNRQRYIAITGVPQGRSAGDIQRDIQKAISGLKLPSGYYWDWGTTQKRRAEEFGGLSVAVLLAIGLIYMLLATQFESFIHPLTILLSVPLAICGVVLALFLSGRAFGLTAFIGVLMLVGIVVKNGILLVDYTNLLRRRGIEREEAVLTAGPTRMRPIMMTASAAILGMMPLALGIGRGSEIQAPMATAVIGGLLTSTFLTLFIVPTVYTLLDDIVQRFHPEHVKKKEGDLGVNDA